MEAEDIPARAAAAGARLSAGLAELDGVADVRGLGLLLGARLETDRAREVTAAALAAGLVVNAPRPDTVRLAPSLLVTDHEIDEALAILAGVLAGVPAAPVGTDGVRS
jgi:acetylornithine aminotransferase